MERGEAEKEEKLGTTTPFTREKPMMLRPTHYKQNKRS